MDLTEVFEIPLNEIEVGELNVRKHDREDSIEELAQSIDKHGLMQPILLLGEYGNPPYKIIVGQRRFLAHKLLKKENIKCIFSGEIDHIHAILLSLAENMQRVELNHADKAANITELYKHFGKNEYEVADALGLSVRTIRDYIKIGEQATDQAKKLLQANIVSKADVKRAIDASLGDKNKADELLLEIGKLTKYDKSRAVSFGKNNPDASAVRIIEEAKKPKVQETIILQLPKHITKAAQLAADDLSMDVDELALKAFEDWLDRNNYIL